MLRMSDFDNNFGTLNSNKSIGFKDRQSHTLLILSDD